MRVAVVGCGSIGVRHARNVAALGHAVLCYDANLRRAHDLAHELGGTLATDAAGVLAWEPDAACVCTPPDSHVFWAKLLSYTGVHLFIEKPLALDLLEARRLLVRIHPGQVVHVACPLRYIPALQAWHANPPKTLSIHAAYHLPTVRPDYLAAYHGTTGVLLDIGSHAVDLAQWLRGPAALSACTLVRADGIGLACDGQADVWLKHATGPDTTIWLDWLTPGPRRWEVYADDRAWLMPDNIDAAYRDEMRAFFRAIEYGEHVDNPLDEALATLRLLMDAKGVTCAL